MTAGFRVTPNFRKAYKRKTRDGQLLLDQCLETLITDPENPTIQRKKLSGAPGVWEARADYYIRVTFHYDGETIVLHNNCNHDIYRLK